MQTTSRIESLIQNGYQIDLGKMVSSGWEIFKQNIGGFIGYFIVMCLIFCVSALTGIGTFIVTMPLIMGFALVANKIYKGQTTEFGDFFGGFSFMGQLIVYMLIVGLGMLILLLPMGFSFFGVLKEMTQSGAMNDPEAQTEFVSRLLSAVGWSSLLIIPIIYVGVGLFLAPYLIVFENMQAWDSIKASWALVNKNWLMVFACLLVAGVIYSAGSFLLYIGTLFTAPLAHCMQYALFRQIVPVEDSIDTKINEIGNNW